jgi:hypothetical protein
MSTIVIDVDDKSSAKLFLELAKKLRFKARILNDRQKEDWALLAMMEARDIEPALPVESTLDILRGIKSK